MKKFMQLLLVSLVLIWSSGVFADESGNKTPQSPESLVTCLSVGTHGILSRSISGIVNEDQCKPLDPCSPCITSLEGQGCKVVDVVVTNLMASENNAASMATYLFSCDSR